MPLSLIEQYRAVAVRRAVAVPTFNKDWASHRKPRIQGLVGATPTPVPAPRPPSARSRIALASPAIFPSVLLSFWSSVTVSSAGSCGTNRVLRGPRQEVMVLARLQNMGPPTGVPTVWLKRERRVKIEGWTGPDVDDADPPDTPG
jgi:hypothetical protein